MSSYLADNAAFSALLLKAFPFLQAKGAEAVSVAGSFMAAVGLILGFHAVNNWHETQKVMSANRQEVRMIAEKQLRIKMEDVALVQAEKEYEKRRGINSGSISSEKYNSAVVNARSFLIDEPHWASKYGVQTNLTWSHNAAKSFSVMPVPVYSGVQKVVFNVQGTYTRIKNLYTFFHSMPYFSGVSAIRIVGNKFFAKVAVYGVVDS